MERKGYNRIFVIAALTLLALMLFFSSFSYSLPSFAAETEVYTVLFDKNGGTLTGSDSIFNIEKGSLIPTVPTVSKEGYDLDGWYTYYYDQESGEKVIVNKWNFDTDTVGSHILLIAMYKPKIYTVTFDSDGGSPSPQSKGVAYASLIQKPDDPSKPGFAFAGWFHGSTEWDFFQDTMPAHNLELIAKWEITYAVRYLSGSDSAGPDTTVYKRQDKSLVLADALFTRTGHTQTGWALSNGGAKAYGFGDVYDLNAPLTLYPSWAKNIYTVKFDINGGSGKAPNAQSVTHGEVLSPFPSSPAKEGFSFSGWYNGNILWQSSYLVSSNMTLIAKWAINKPEDKEIEQIVQDGKIVLSAGFDDSDNISYDFEWYVLGGGGEWELLEGENGKKLALSDEDGGRYKCVIVAVDKVSGSRSAQREIIYDLLPKAVNHIYWIIWMLLIIIIAQGAFLFYFISKASPKSVKMNSFIFAALLSVVPQSEIVIVAVEAVVVVVLGILLIYFFPDKIAKRGVLKDRKNVMLKNRKVIVENPDVTVLEKERIELTGSPAEIPAGDVSNEQSAGERRNDEENGAETIRARAVPLKQKTKSVEDFYEEEMVKVEEEIAAERDPLIYIQKAIELAYETNHITALKMIFVELTKELERLKEESLKAQREAEILAQQDIEQEEDAETEGESEEEKQKAEEEAEKAVEEFLRAKRNNEEDVPVPELRFTLSREDVLDYVEDTSRCQAKYTVPMTAVLKKKHYYPDIIKCGDWAFALLTEKKKVIKFSLRASLETRKRLEAEYAAAYPCIYFDKDGESFVVDSSVKSKDEVFSILDECYFYTLENFYREEEKTRPGVAYRAKKDFERVEQTAQEQALKQDEKYNAAIKEYDKALKKLKAGKEPKLNMTRWRFVKYAQEFYKYDILIFERPNKWFLPSTIRSSGKTCVLAYEKAGELILTARVDDEFAKNLQAQHPQVKRARFPKGRNWYTITIDGTFKNAQSVYSILKCAKKFADKTARREFEKY